jgi:hypothetical protein
MNLNRQSELTWPFQRGGVCVAPVMLLASLGVYLAVSVKAQSPARDPDYNPGFAGAVQSQAVQPDGKILLAGSFTKLGGLSRTNLGRLNPDGTVDPTFSIGENARVNCLVLQPDGKILVGG